MTGYENHWTDIRGWESPAEQNVLLSYARKVPNRGYILEIGSEFGMSASLFRFASHDNVQITCVDINPDAPFKQNLAAKGLWYNIKAHYTSSAEFYGYYLAYKTLKDEPDSLFDLIFIDGDHSEEGAYLDISECSKILIEGGYLLIHDVAMASNKNPHAQHFQVKRAFDRWFKEQKKDAFKIVESVDSLLVIQKL